MSKNPVVHFEMPYDDAARLKGFYEKVFGWNVIPLGEDMGNYVIVHTAETGEDNMVRTPGTINGGFSLRNEDYGEPRVVISVPDLEAAMADVAEAGGSVSGEPVDIPGVGRYVSFIDSEGNKVSMLQPAGM